MGIAKVLATASVVASCVAVSAVDSLAVTNQFRGVNWADKRDNFVSDVLVLSGMSATDTYESASVVAERVVGQFVEMLGTNSLRIPVNEPTVTTSYWNTYKGIIDVSLGYGKVVMGYWGPAQPAGPSDMNKWWAMWETIVKEYGDHPEAYFEIFNEPHMYSKNELRELYAEWLSRFPDVPRDHILLDGSGLAWNIPDIADDPRFEGCLFAVHEYSFWNMSIDTEEGWMNSFKGKVGKYADRTVCTEWGGAMGPGEKAGIQYDYMDYNQKPTNYFMAYIRGMTEQLRQWEMGSFYWVGLRDGDWYSMVKRNGEGANIKLEIVNQSGVDRMQYSWTDTVEVNPVPQEPFGKVEGGVAVAGERAVIPGKIETEDFDLGGNRNAYYDKDKANQGTLYRDEGVDIVGVGCSDSAATKDCKGYAVGYAESGEWIEYSVNVVKKAKYFVKANVASGLDVAKFMLLVDDKAVSDTVKVPRGEDWTTYGVVEFETAEIDEGEHTLKLKIVGDYGNYDWFMFCAEKDCKDVDVPADTAAPGDAVAPADTASPAPQPSDTVDADSSTAIHGSVLGKARLEAEFAGVPQNFQIFTMNGHYLGTLRSTWTSLKADARMFVGNNGAYIVKPQHGSVKMLRISK